MKTLEEFLFNMEFFPHTLAEPRYGFTQDEIKAFAAEIREKANLPRTQEPDPNLQLMEWRYSGECNGCGAAVFVPVTSIETKKLITVADAVSLLETAHLKPDVFIGMGGDGMGTDVVYLYVKRKPALKPIKEMFSDYANVVVEYHGPIVVRA